ncbi:MAG: transposase [Myxococcales bacterium]|nr:transposase [Myxococcales bacterium]
MLSLGANTRIYVDTVEIDAGELAMLLEGIDAKRVRRHKRYKRDSIATELPARTTSAL